MNFVVNELKRICRFKLEDVDYQSFGRWMSESISTDCHKNDPNCNCNKCCWLIETW